MMRGWADWLSLVFVVAIVYLLVRPGSKAAETVGAFTDMIVSMVRRATDLAASTT
jgi:hypothetical protein